MMWLFQVMKDTRRTRLGKASTRKRKRRELAAADSTRFKVLVCTYPASSLEPSIDLLKAAVIYGDEVLVHSPLAALLAGMASVSGASSVDLLAFARSIAPVLQDDGRFVAQLETLEAQYGPDGALRLFSAVVDGSSDLEDAITDPQVYWELIQQKERWAAVRAELERQAEVALEGAGAGLVLPAIEANLLRLAPFDMSDDFVESYVSTLEHVLRDPGYHPLLDQGIADLVDAAIRAGVMSLTPQGTQRSRQVGAANEFLAKLPTFPGATMDEIVDIRSELDRPLVRFRSEMVSVADGLGVDAHDPAFGEASAEAWIGRVRPALEELDELVEEKRLTRLFGGIDATTATGAVSSLVAGVLTGTPALGIPAAATAAGTAGNLVQKRFRLEREIRKRPYYLLHLTNERLS